MAKAYSTHTKAYFKLLETANWVEQQVKECLNEFDLTHPQFNVLKILKGSSPTPLSASDIKNRMIVNSPDISRLLDRLVKKDLIERRTCPDNRRKIEVLISKKGQELLKAINPAINLKVQAFFHQAISQEEARQLHDTLSKIVASKEK